MNKKPFFPTSLLAITLAMSVLGLPTLTNAIEDISTIPLSIAGENSNGLRWSSVRPAGDVNGDGYDDVLIVEPGFEDAADSSIEGRTYLFYGKSDIATTFSFEDSVVINHADSSIGASVAGACDVNGDGYDDFLLGGNGKATLPAVYLQYGQPETIADLTTSDLVPFYPENPGEDGAGIRGVACAGDVNGDGYDDMLIGAGNYSEVQEDAGAVYLVYGQAELFTELNLGDAIRFSGTKQDKSLGWSVAGVGDLNADGFDDCIISSPANSRKGYQSGAAYIIYGRASEYTNRSVKKLVALYGEDGDDALGTWVSTVGDINNDGHSDALIVSPYKLGKDGEQYGAIYMLYGREKKYQDGSIKRFSYLRGEADRFMSSGNISSTSGDIDGDGFSDILASTRALDSSADYVSMSYIISGKAKKYDTRKIKKKTHGYYGSSEHYFGSNSYFYGDAVSFIGDIDSNGQSDVSIIDDNDDEFGNNFGKIYLIIN